VIRGNVVTSDRIIEMGSLRFQREDGLVGAVAPPAGRDSSMPRTWIMRASSYWQSIQAVKPIRKASAGPRERLPRAEATTIVDMPYDDPDRSGMPTSCCRKIELVDAESHVDVALYATISRQVGPRPFRGLIDAGAVAFKFSTFEAAPVAFSAYRPKTWLYDAFRMNCANGLGLRRCSQPGTRN